MATFDRLSRYAKPPLESYTVVDTRNREVRALPVPARSVETTAGVHVKKEGQNLDQLANGYLADPHGYWRIVELNGAILPDALEERETLLIPNPVR